MSLKQLGQKYYNNFDLTDSKKGKMKIQDNKIQIDDLISQVNQYTDFEKIKSGTLYGNIYASQ